jgi:hypothetical protein
MTVKHMFFAAFGLYSVAVTPVASEENATAKTFATRGVTELGGTVTFSYLNYANQGSFAGAGEANIGLNPYVKHYFFNQIHLDFGPGLNYSYIKPANSLRSAYDSLLIGPTVGFGYTMPVAGYCFFDFGFSGGASYVTLNPYIAEGWRDYRISFNPALKFAFQSAVLTFGFSVLYVDSETDYWQSALGTGISIFF